MFRPIAVLALAVCALGLIVGYGVAFNGSSVHPDTAAIDRAYDAHVGSQLHLWGRVVSTGEQTIVRSGSLRLTTTRPLPEAEPGDRLQVYGTLLPDRRIEPIRSHGVADWQVWYLYGVSTLGATLAAVGFLRRWRLDTDSWVFTPREAE